MVPDLSRLEGNVRSAARLINGFMDVVVVKCAGVADILGGLECELREPEPFVVLIVVVGEVDSGEAGWCLYPHQPLGH